MRRHLCQRYALFFFLICLPVLFAQVPAIQFQNYNIGDGLSLNAVQSISQDSTGFLWFGTADGLNRFDGYTFDIYRPVAFDSVSLSDWEVTAICHDYQDRQWIGTLKGGLNLQDKATGTFYHFRHDINDPHTLSHDSVTTIFQDDDHRLWIGTVNGLNRLILPEGADNSPVSEWIHQVQFIHYGSTSDSVSLSDPHVTCMTMDQEGRLWVGTNWGLNVAYPDSMKFVRFFSLYDCTDCLESNYIRCLYRDDSGRLWVGTEYGGLSRVIIPKSDISSDGKMALRQIRFESFLSDENNTGSISSDVVHCIFQDTRGILWLGTEKGLNHFNIEQKHFTNWQHDPEDPFSLSNNVIWTLYKDRSGLYWLGTDGGINTFHGKEHQFQKFQHHPDKPETLSHPYVWSFSEDKAGFVWIGTSFGLNRFNPADGSLKAYYHDPGRSHSLTDNNIMSLCIDRDNILWVGLNGLGLDRAVLGETSPPEFIPVDCSEKGVDSDYILSLYEDREGALWIGAWDRGLRKILPEDRHAFVRKNSGNVHVIQFLPDRDNPHSISPNRIYAMLQDRTGALWIATDGDGLNVLSPEHVLVRNPSLEIVQFAHFRHDPSDPNSLSCNIVLCIQEDQNGDLWFGTFGGGLCQYLRHENRFIHYTTKDGLPNNIVYGILEDEDGFFWLSTNKGLSKFDPENRNFHNFTVHDGLQDYEYNSGAFLKTRTGHILFGGINGFNYFHPQDISLNTYIPQVVIKDLRVDNRSVHASQDRIRLSHRQSLVSIEFAALSYIFPEKNRYRYRMTPLDDSWIDAGTERKVTYTHLKPGNYTFQVIGSNNDGVWNEKGATLNIRIDPPFWQTVWFKVLLVFLILALVSLVFQIRTQSINRLNRILERKVQERTEALQTALDDVNTLEGLLPMCAACKKIRDDDGTWHQVDVYIRKHSDVKFSHGLCPECYKEYEKQL